MILIPLLLYSEIPKLYIIRKEVFFFLIKKYLFGKLQKSLQLYKFLLKQNNKSISLVIQKKNVSAVAYFGRNLKKLRCCGHHP
jgi:hypothetical protein